MISLREHRQEFNLTPPKVISAGHSAEETCKHVCKILKSNKTIDLHKISKHSKHKSQTSSQTTDIIKKRKFCKNSCHCGKCSACGKVYHKCKRKNHFKKCCPCNRKSIHKIEQTENESPFADKYKFFRDMIKLQRNPENLGTISEIKNESSDWNIKYWCSE